jgi:aryl-alcohol dehydrogenase-like predicted oxidoreductase
LGNTDMDITRVGFGTWAVGGGDWAFAWGPQDDEQSIDAIRYAVESGINWLDTAAIYGLGHSEEVVARTMSGLAEQDRPYLFTKCGLVWDDNERHKPPRRIGAPESIRVELEASLRRLKVERVDLYQVHWPAADGSRVDDYWGALLALKDEGKIRAVGLCNHDVAQLATAEALGHVDSFQPPFSAIKRGAAAELDWCASHSTGVIVYSPMQSGLLTGSFSPERAVSLRSDDWRSRDIEFQGERLERNLALAESLRPIALRRSTTLATVAVAWVLAWPGVTGAIVGARRANQVDGWLPAATLELSEAELDEIALAIQTTGAGSGPARP